MSCLGEHGPRNTKRSMIWYDAWESYFDFISAVSLSNPCPAFGDVHYPGPTLLHSLLTINAHQITSMRSQKSLDLYGEKHSSWICAVFYFYCCKIIFKSLICILGPYTALYEVQPELENQTQTQIKLNILKSHTDLWGVSLYDHSV